MKKQALQTATSPLIATVSLPGSKSITNRALLLAALAEGTSRLSGCLCSDDSLAFMAALQHLGVMIEVQGELVVVHGQARLHSSDTVWCQDAGTAARFLLAACSAFPGEFHIDGSARLRERPLKALIDACRQLGATIDADVLPCQIRGAQLSGGDVSLDASDSTQFISALLMIAPFMQNPLRLCAEQLNRDAYIGITAQMMAQFGVQVTRDGDCYQVALPQAYEAREYAIEPDLSTASYFFAAAAVTQGKITVNNIDKDHCLQGDIRFVEVLAQMGCTVTHDDNSVTVQGPEQLQGVEVNMQDFSDPFMTLAAIAPYANASTTIHGLAHTRLQESDRVAAIAEELTKCGVTVETGEDWIRIHPGLTHAATVYSHHDHRIAMSLAVFALKTPGLVLQDPDCVAKTCPDFFARLAAL